MERLGLVAIVGVVGCLRADPGNPRQVHPVAVTQPVVAAVQAPGVARTLLGQPVTATDAVRLAALVQAPERYAGQTVRTEGTVSAVCQAMGCWMEVRDEAAQVHVRMHGHSFFIPRDARGRHAVVQATVIAANPGGECEREAAQQTGQQVAALELDATGVELQ